MFRSRLFSFTPLSIIFAALILALMIVAPAVAIAAETVDATPIFDTAANGLESLLLGVSSVVVGWVGYFAKKWFGAETAARTRELVESALRNGVNVIMQEVRAKGQPVARVTIENPAVALGVRYVISAVPSALKQLGIGEGQIAAKLVARIPVPPAT